MSTIYLEIFIGLCFFSGFFARNKYPALFGLLKAGAAIALLTFLIIIALNLIFNLSGNEIYYPVIDIMLIKIFPKPIFALLIGYALIFHSLGGIVKCFVQDLVKKSGGIN